MNSTGVSTRTIEGREKAGLPWHANQRDLQAFEANVWQRLPEARDSVAIHAGYTEVKATGKRFNEGLLVGTRHEMKNVVRGRIGAFSTKSKARLTKTLLELKELTPFFLTLTYPKVFPTPARAKVDLENFIKRLRRRFPKAYGIWKQEPQKRGAIHFHILLDLGEGVPMDELGRRDEYRYRGKRDSITTGWVAEAWYEIVGSADPKHLRRGTDLRDLRLETDAQTKKMVMAYVSKYMGKTVFTESEIQTAWETPGRWWGVFNRPAYAEACVPVCRYSLDEVESAQFRRILRKLIKSRGGRHYARHCAKFGSWFAVIEDYTTRTILAHIKGVGAVCKAGTGAAWGTDTERPETPDKGLIGWLYG